MKEISINQVQDLLDLKLKAIEDNDLPKYLETISTSSDNYINEQIRWFNDVINYSIKDLSFKVISIKHLEQGQVEAIVHQKHFYKSVFDIKYPLLVGYENDLLIDFDLNFKIVETSRYIIKYLEGETRFKQFLDVVETLFDSIEKIFTERIDKIVEIKIYNDNELLRQRVMPSIGWLFYGWAEQDESLKFYSGLEDINNYHGLIQHELVHMITLNISKDCSVSWITEGIAMHYGCAYYPLKGDVVLKDINKYDLNKTLEYLEGFDYFNETDIHLIFEWYAICGMYIKYMIESSSHEKVMNIFYECGKYIQTEDSSKISKSKFLYEVILNVLGKSKAELNIEYLAWIKKQVFDLS